MVIASMKEQAVRSIGLVVSAAILGGCILWACLPKSGVGDHGEWKPTGDGKTIVNSKTGELRLTRNGESVEFAEEMRLRQIELNKIIAEKEARKRKEESEREEAAEDARKAREVQYVHQQEAARQSSNSEKYRQIKQFVELRWDQGFRPAPAGSRAFTEWYLATSPIRDGKPLTAANAKALGELLGRLRDAELARTSRELVSAVQAGKADEADAISSNSDPNISMRTTEWDHIVSVLNSIKFSASDESVPLPAR